MDNFRIYFENSAGRANDRFTISVNDRIINTYPLDVNLVDFDCELISGWNVLEVAFDRRSHDGAVRIDEVYVNRSAMKYLLNDFGKVVPNWQRDPMLRQWYENNQGQAPESFPKRKILDMPGVYRFEFRMPLRDFLEDFYKIPEQYKKQYNQPIEQYSRLEKMLQNAKTS